MTRPGVQLLLVDDSPVVRVGLKALLSLDAGIEVVGEAGDGDAAIRLAQQIDPDVVLLDVRMPGRDGLSAVAELAEMSTVVMLTFSDEPEVIQQALRDGASGYLVHGTFDAQSLAAMVRAAAAGSGSFSGPALDVLRGGGRVPSVTEARSGLGLSSRQVEVMDLIAAGKGNREIAKELFLAEKTIKNHINQIFASLGVTTRAEAIVLWLDPSERREL